MVAKLGTETFVPCGTGMHRTPGHGSTMMERGGHALADRSLAHDGHMAVGYRYHTGNILWTPPPQYFVYGA